MLKPNKLANNNFLSSLDLSTDEVLHILDLAKNLKNKKLIIELNDKVLGLIFDKSSTRTRVSFQVAMTRLGGTTIDLNPTTSQMGRGEPNMLSGLQNQLLMLLLIWNIHARP